MKKLEELPQIKTTTTVEPFYFATAIADGLLTIYTPQKQLEHVVEVKSHLTLETLDLAISYLNLRLFFGKNAQNQITESI